MAGMLVGSVDRTDKGSLCFPSDPQASSVRGCGPASVLQNRASHFAEAANQIHTASRLQAKRRLMIVFSCRVPTLAM